jgi:hypothetical protein
MKRRDVGRIALVGAAALAAHFSASTGALAESAAAGKAPNLQSAGALAFDDGNVLFVGDTKAGLIHAFDLGADTLDDQAAYQLGRAQTFEGRTILNGLDVEIGVGSNMAEGAPLQSGESYKLVVSGTMLSAAGVALGADHSFAFRVGPANRSAIKPDNWKILLPAAGTRSALTVNIDRLLDDGAAHRLLRILNGDDLPVTGQVKFDGLTWSFTPRTPWQPGNYQLMIDPELEDVSGNTTGAAFDAPAGTIGQVAHPTFINFLIE